MLVPLSRSEPARFERSQWGGETAGELVVVEPAEFMILEGVTASREAFAPYVTYAIWVEATAELRLRRGLDRDGPAALEQWHAWMAEEERYRSRERPDDRADLVIQGDRDLWSRAAARIGEHFRTLPGWGSGLSLRATEGGSARRQSGESRTQ